MLPGNIQRKIKYLGIPYKPASKTLQVPAVFFIFKKNIFY